VNLIKKNHVFISFHNIFNSELFFSLTDNQQNILLVQTPAVSH